MKENVPKLGEIIKGTARRDAIHVACAPVLAHRALVPGEHVGIHRDGSSTSDDAPKVGVVDPFLAQSVGKGQEFWLLLYPNTVTGLRHEWSHPAFDDAQMPEIKVGGWSVDDDRKWVEAFAEELGVTTTKLMEAAVRWLADGERTDLELWKKSSKLMADSGAWKEFWERYGRLTGDLEGKGCPFSAFDSDDDDDGCSGC